MRTTQITSVITTLIICIGDVSASASFYNGPRFERRGIYDDPVHERSLGHDYESEAYERDIFFEGVDFGRSLAARDLYDREVTLYERETRTPTDLGLLPRGALDIISDISSVCGILTFGIVFGSALMYWIGVLTKDKAKVISKATGGRVSESTMEAGGVFLKETSKLAPGTGAPESPAPPPANSPLTHLPPGDYKVYRTTKPGGTAEYVLNLHIDAEKKCHYAYEEQASGSGNGSGSGSKKIDR
ncbi:hypothetical protein MMC19_003494 [Ptychographa xylographoides]|nr:hypothetical protein [Ptychographa xylographoides]